MKRLIKRKGTCAAGARLSSVAVAALLSFGASALAQEATPQQVAQEQSGENQLETIIVTGLAIKGNPDVESSNPISVVGSDTIDRTNSLNIQNLLSQLPSVGSQGL